MCCARFRTVNGKQCAALISDGLTFHVLACLLHAGADRISVCNVERIPEAVLRSPNITSLNLSSMSTAGSHYRVCVCAMLISAELQGNGNLRITDELAQMKLVDVILAGSQRFSRMI
jgi:hypothetical protein